MVKPVLLRLPGTLSTGRSLQMEYSEIAENLDAASPAAVANKTVDIAAHSRSSSELLAELRYLSIAGLSEQEVRVLIPV